MPTWAWKLFQKLFCVYCKLFFVNQIRPGLFRQKISCAVNSANAYNCTYNSGKLVSTQDTDMQNRKA